MLCAICPLLVQTKRVFVCLTFHMALPPCSPFPARMLKGQSMQVRSRKRCSNTLGLSATKTCFAEQSDSELSQVNELVELISLLPTSFWIKKKKSPKSENLQNSSKFIISLKQQKTDWSINYNSKSVRVSPPICGLSMEHWIMNAQFSYRYDHENVRNSEHPLQVFNGHTL